MTVHDSPAVCGGAFFFKLLDRRGGRRMAQLLSDLIGRRAERALLQRAEKVCCLSALGAAQLTDRLALSRPVQLLPHVAMVTGTPVADRRSIFLPGYLDGLENVAPAILALTDVSEDWRVEIGACGEETKIDAQSLARRLGVEERVQLLSFLDEQELDDAFERAAIVIRWNASGWARNGEAQRGAVSGPLIKAMGHGCAIVTNDTRGITECLPDAGAIQIDSGQTGGDQVRQALTTLIRDEARRDRMSATGRRHVSREHDIVTVARKLAEG